MKIKNVTCETMKCPLAVTVAHPAFSWKIESDKPNIFQTSWQIVVTKESGDVVWNSGVQEGADTIGIAYDGIDLESCTCYCYRVTSWNNFGEKSESEENRFETAFFDYSEWQANWIEPEPLPQLAENPLPQAQKEWQETMSAMMRGEQVEMRTEGDILNALPLEPYDPAVRMRKAFACKGSIHKARLYVTAHGIYDVRINGREVTDTLLNPGFTTYDKRIRYQVYEVDSLTEGENAIAVTVADGWYKGKIAYGRGCEYGEVPGLLLQLEVTYQNGDKDVICSDGTWRFSYDGPVRTADLFLGETFDARMDDGDPSDTAYDASDWKSVYVKDAPDALVEAQEYPPVSIFAEMPAQKVWTAPNGDTLVDFGQNLAGMIRVTVRGEEGESITFEHGEVLDKDGNYFYIFEGTNIEQKDTYICCGAENKVYQPKFTYHGFRYVRVKGGKNWTKDQFTALAISTDNPVTGSFSCSDDQLNQLQSNIYWSQRSNNIGIPTDCPTREKAGWTGDVVTYGATALYNQEMTAFYKDWLKSIRIEQKENGLILGTVPQIKSYIQQSETGSLGWGDVILTLPWQLYQLYGEKRVLEENYQAMSRWMTAMEQAAYELPTDYNISGPRTVFPEQMEGRQLDNQHYLINSGFHFGDWIIPSVVNEQGFTDGPASAFLTMNYADTSLLAHISDLYAQISELLGYESNAVKYRAYSKRVREAFEEEYVTKEQRLGQEMQGNYILALKYQMVPDKTAIKFAARLNEMIEKNQYRLDTGFMSTPHLLDVLCDYGYQDTAWKVLFQKNCPSWLYEIEHGATTMWENWDAISPEGTIHDCSFNHYAFGCVGDFLYRRVLGIQNAGIAYDKILLAPEYDCPLKNATGTYESVRGKISFSWEKTSEGIKISGSIPANTTAVLRLPDGEEMKLVNGGFTVETTIK
ncbi:alpha-L-rhamnosidase [Lachnospiraceae bacterium PF1-21]